MRLVQRWTQHEHDCIVKTYATHTAQQQAAMLERPLSSVLGKRQMLLNAGVLDQTQRCYNARYTPDQIEHARLLASEGVATRTIARKLGRTELGLLSTMLYHGIGVRTVRADPLSTVYSAESFAKMMGIHFITIRRWYHKGIIPHTQKQRRKGDTILINETTVESFLAMREHWPRWYPDAITDLAWRTRAETLRAEAGGYWMPTHEAAHHWHYECHTMVRRLRQARIPSLRIGQIVYFWSADVLALPPIRMLSYREAITAAYKAGAISHDEAKVLYAA